MFVLSSLTIPSHPISSHRITPHHATPRYALFPYVLFITSTHSGRLSLYSCPSLFPSCYSPRRSSRSQPVHTLHTYIRCYPASSSVVCATSVFCSCPCPSCRLCLSLLPCLFVRTFAVSVRAPDSLTLFVRPLIVRDSAPPSTTFKFPAFLSTCSFARRAASLLLTYPSSFRSEFIYLHTWPPYTYVRISIWALVLVFWALNARLFSYLFGWLVGCLAVYSFIYRLSVVVSSWLMLHGVVRRYGVVPVLVKV